MFSARGVALNVTTASVQLRVLNNSVYLSARLKLRGTNSTVPLFLTFALDGGEKLHATATLPPVSIVQESWCAPSRSVRCGVEKNSCICLESNPDRRYTD
jgi:hypothetical protein